MPTTPRNSDDRQYPLDWWLFLVTLVLLSFGVVMVFDASYPHALEIHDDGWYFFKKQCLWSAIGLCGMFIASRIKFWKLQGWAVPMMVVSAAMLIAVHFVGHGALGAQRWIGYGPIRIQPSEFAKLAIVLYLAKVLSSRPKLAQDLWGGVIPVFAVAGALIFLVEREPDLGTAVTMLLTLLIVLYAGGVKGKWVAGLAAFCAICGSVAILHNGLDNYRVKRLTAFVNPKADELRSGYQIIHSTIALGTGGLTGVGFGESREKRLGNLPMQRTDFIFAIIGEELGLAGTCGVLVLFAALAGRGLHIAQRTKDPFGALLATGITAMVSVQAIVNIGVVTASIPATGVPLPFISYGGSSLVPTLFGIGILLSISQYPFRTDPRPSARRQRGDGDRANDRTPALPSPPRRPSSGGGGFGGREVAR
jgi:cell division protein FtsW